VASAYDAIVIGAGVMGASIAFQLARAGLHRTLVVERRAVCSGNTRKSGALVRMHYSNQPEARMALGSLPYFQRWSDLVGYHNGFQPVGFLLLVGPGNRERLVRNVAMQRSLGINTSVVEGDDLRELLPGVDLEDGAVGAYEPESGYADPVATTHSFMRSAVNHGVSVVEGVSVTAIRQRGGKVVGVDTSDGAYDAPIVVCAANIWSPALLRTAGVELDLSPMRSQMAFYRAAEPLRAMPHVVLDLAKINYGRPHGDDRVLIGTPAKDAPEPVDPDNYDENVDPEFPAWVRDRMAARVPSVASLEADGGQAGVYDMSPDTRAILDRAPGVDGLFLAAGFSGSGFKISPMIGACMAELATEGRATSVDIRPFRFSRFAENDPICGEHEYAMAANWGMKW
jgi:sarcosine oxidase subunit beta